MAKARWKEMTAAEKAEFSDKSQKKIKELTTSVEKSKQRWSAADAIEDPLLGKYPMAHVLQLLPRSLEARRRKNRDKHCRKRKCGTY